MPGSGEGDAGTLFPASEAVQGQRQSRRAYQAFLERMDDFGWGADYQRLIQEGWDWRKAVYIAWEASPAMGRQPATQAELATQVLGLKSDRTIRTWRKRHPEIEQTIAALQAAPLLRHRREIFEALVLSATNPDARHHRDRRMALEMLGDYNPRGTPQQDEQDAGSGMTLDAWQAAAAQRRAQVEETLADFDEEDEDDGDEA